MRSINDLAIEYGRQVEALLKQLGAGGPTKGAGELLDQVQHLIDPEGLRQVRWFLRLRNRVVHPSEKGKSSKEELERAGRAALAALQRALAAQARRGNSARGEPVQREVSPDYAIGSRRFRRFVVRVIRQLSWRLVFLPELVGLTLLAVMVNYIDTMDEILGIPVKHIVAGVGTSVFVSFFTSSLGGGFLALLLVPLSGYFVYRISVGLERAFPGTSFYYYRKWFSSPQVLLPLPDEEAIPLVWDEVGQAPEEVSLQEEAKGVRAL